MRSSERNRSVRKIGGVASGVAEAIDSSVFLYTARRVATGSRLVAYWAAVSHWAELHRGRVVVGLGGTWTTEDERRQSDALRTVSAASRLMSLSESWLVAVPRIAQMSWIVKRFGVIGGSGLCERVQLGAWVLFVAVTSHIVFLALSDVSVTWIGWGVRGGLLALALFLLSKPEAWASAWLDWTAKHEEHPFSQGSSR